MFLIYLFFLHLLADFILQPREMGRKKSDNLIYLAGHVLIQYLVFLLGLIVAYHYEFLPVQSKYEARVFINGFALANAAIHGLIDGITWNLYKFSVVLRKPKQLFGRPTQGDKPVFKYWEDHYFYLTIGIDQFLHISTIVLVFELIKQNLYYL